MPDSALSCICEKKSLTTSAITLLSYTVMECKEWEERQSPCVETYPGIENVQLSLFDQAFRNKIPSFLTQYCCKKLF